MAAIADVRSISIRKQQEPDSRATSSTSGVKGVVLGKKSWTADITVDAQSAPNPIKGTTGTLTITLTTSLTLAATCYLLGIDEQVDINSGATVGYVYHFVGTAELTEADPTTPDQTPIAATGVTVDFT